MSDLIDLTTSIQKVIAGFCLKKGDHMVAISDPGVESPVRAALNIAIGEIQLQTSSSGIKAGFVRSAQPTGSAQPFEPEVEEKMEQATALLYLTSLSRSHCAQTHKFVLSDRPGRERARLISITNGRADTLLVGAANENFDEMRKRIKRINKLCENVKFFHITSPEGTNFWVRPWTRYAVVDDGLINEPGKLGNFPFGEGASTAVKFLGTTGVIVSNRGVGNGLGRLKDPIRMAVLNGKIVAMEGGEQARTLKAAMKEADAKIADTGICKLPNPSYWLAEVSFGANAEAWREEGGRKVLPPTSLEAEKAYSEKDASLHVAHGANYVFGVPKHLKSYNPVGHHTDHVLQGGITVDAYPLPGFGKMFRLIDQGVPIY